MANYIIKLVLEFQFDLQNPLKQPKIWMDVYYIKLKHLTRRIQNN